ncbi:hypothetical protein [Calothrix sp. 336/3]|nr:hypothetical protein [Calothrix sp. 336/3]
MSLLNYQGLIPPGMGLILWENYFSEDVPSEVLYQGFRAMDN